jgi:RNA polymerase sigma-70 factor (ECF subfamily)
MDVACCVRQARHGSQQAFSMLYRRFSPLVHGILLGRFSPATADDLTQECFATAFARLNQLQEEEKFGAWISVIARRIRPPAEVSKVSDHDIEEVRDSATKPEDVTEADRFLRAIANLPEAYRETLMLRLAEGMSGPEIAALTGLTPQSVRVNLHRGMAKLREALNLAQSPAETQHD